MSRADINREKIKNSLKYEEINLLYVAVTRAKKVLYLPDYIMEKI